MLRESANISILFQWFERNGLAWAYSRYGRIVPLSRYNFRIKYDILFTFFLTIIQGLKGSKGPGAESQIKDKAERKNNTY